MRIDWSRIEYTGAEEQRLIQWMRGARAVAASLVIGGITLMAATSGPVDTERELATAHSNPVVHAKGGADAGLMALETGVRI